MSHDWGHIPYGTPKSGCSCCKDCAKRSFDCHIGCEDYAAEVILSAVLATEKKKQTAFREDTYTLAERRAQMNYRRAKNTRNGRHLAKSGLLRKK